VLERELGTKRSEISLFELAALKRQYGLSMQAIMYRAVSCGIISDYSYEQFSKMISAKGWRKTEPVTYPIPEQPRRFKQLFHKALSEDLISISISIKDVITDEGTASQRRYIVVRNPESVARDKKIRDDIVSVTQQKLNELTQLSGEAHTKQACTLRSHSAYGRYIRQDEDRRLFLNTEKIASEALLETEFVPTYFYAGSPWC